MDALREKFRGVAGERVARIRARDDVERELHTLKGEAELLGFAAVARVVERLEKQPEPSEAGLTLIERLVQLPHDDAGAGAEVDTFLAGLDP